MIDPRSEPGKMNPFVFDGHMMIGKRGKNDIVMLANASRAVLDTCILRSDGDAGEGIRDFFFASSIMAGDGSTRCISEIRFAFPVSTRPERNITVRPPSPHPISIMRTGVPNEGREWVHWCTSCYW